MTTEYLILFLSGAVATFLGAFSSGIVSLLCINSLLLLGFGPAGAFFAYKFGSICSRPGSIYEYHKKGLISWRLGLTLAPITLIGSFIGANIFLELDEKTVRLLMGGATVLLIPFSVFKSELGVKRIEVSFLKRSVGVVLVGLAAAWAAISIGVGVFFLYIYMYFFGLTILETKGTDKITALASDIMVSVTFLVGGMLFNMKMIPFAAGMMLGSMLGARYAIKIGNKVLRVIL